ncbi:MAG: hypothetical protein KGJ58_04140, partial [Patescibacteria group bacterium]|nr:hypothetical protein [Patescibacteria group bacterium]
HLHHRHQRTPDEKLYQQSELPTERFTAIVLVRLTADKTETTSFSWWFSFRKKWLKTRFLS